MQIGSDASHTYRGYRLQALYTLHRILTSEENDGLIFQPEGKEDLCVLNVDGHILEIHQVKAHSEKLSLSDFDPEKKDSFFYRIDSLLKEESKTKIYITSYGAIGPELQKALEGDGKEREQIAKKVSRFGFISESGAKNILGNIEIRHIDETVIVREVYDRLTNSLMGIDPDSAFQLLHYWLFIAAEGKRRITRRDVIDRVLVVGKFLAERAAYLKEWGTTILSIDDYEIVDEQERQTLANEFYLGISTNYRHILANLDITRETRIGEIKQKFEQARIVIVHGASGQGKTTLAYRYFHESFPNQWRFQVRLVENRQHALSIAAALAGHADALGMPVTVYLDVSARDKDWPDLVQNLYTHPSIQMLVTVREEDFQRATLSGATVRFEELHLKFDEAEASQVYKSLTEKDIPSEFLNFEEAWTKFGSAGPLMEFVYFITHGNTIRERLKEQVTRLKDDVRVQKLQSAELALLRLVSVASAYEARIKVKPLADRLGLTVPERTFQLFENELS